MSDDVETAIVIDNGTNYCKVGFAGEDSPLDSFPCILAA